MENRYLEFAADFARKIIIGEYFAAQKAFASWVQISPEQLKEFIENELCEMVEVWEFDEIIRPAKFRIGGGVSSIEDLRQPHTYSPEARSSENFPSEITEEHFRAWMVITFLPAEEQELDLDAWFDFWLALVEENDELKIGYFEITDAD